MNETEARQVIATAIARVAPDVDLDVIEPAAELRVEADLDSMDFLHLVEAVSELIGRDIPESAYPRTDTLEGFIAYLVETTTG